MKKIPIKYRKGRAKPVSTVGELIKQLNDFPPSTRITHGFSDQLRVIATLYNGESKHRLLLDEVEESDDD